MRVLLVEDDAGIARFVQRGLAAEGYEVVWKHDGRQVDAVLAAGSFDVIVLDLGLPGRDGLEICHDLRRAGVRTPVLMLTARSTLQDKLEGFGRGADDYLAKPFAFEELVVRIAALARRTARQDDLVFDTLRLDRAAGRATIGEAELPLSQREFGVLAALATARGSLVPRLRLLQEAWGADADVSDNVLDVYVGYLRRALQGFAEAPGIETLRGRGFRLVAAASGIVPKSHST